MISTMRTAALLTAVLSYLPSLTTAQNNVFNETAYLTCPYASMDLYNTTGSVNSTGRVGFRFGDQGGKLTADEYYLSVTFDERRTPNTKYGTYKPEVTHYTHSWLSVPRYLRGNACVYHLQPQNASASGTGMNGCEGVLSQKCYDAILNKKINLPSANDEKQRCSAFYVTKEMEEECGNMFDFDSSQGPWASANGYTIDFSNETCTVDSPTGMSRLEDMRTYAANRIPSQPAFSDSGYTFDWYDRYVLQTRPFLVVVSNLEDRRITWEGGILSDQRVVCVAPTNVTEGSRVPELKFEAREDDEEAGGDGETENGGDESAASHTSWGSAAQLAVYAATAVGLVFVMN